VKLAPHHPYVADDLPADHRGDVPCRCGRPARNEVHELPETDPVAAAAELRRLGESKES
jgi:hypothetical protein